MSAPLPRLRCSVCSSALLPDDPPATDTLCGACAQAPVCDGCELPASQQHRTIGEEILCADCVTDWELCEYCTLYTDSGVRTASDNFVCARCQRDHYTYCDNCRRPALDLYSVDDGDQVCDSCASDYSCCDGCDRLTATIPDFYDPSTYCNRCAGASSDLVRDYGYKPTPIFHGQGPLFLGLELELKTVRSAFTDCAQLAAAALGDLGYLKEDGSIGYAGGFELVTHPMSYQYAIEKFPWDLLPQLKSRGAYVDGDVGIHVHVSRAGFASPAHMYRWMKFVYRNESNAVELARRTSDQWASFSPRARARIVHCLKGSDECGLGNLGRYQAINTLPDHTFEVRIFASSLVPQQVQATLAFVAASVEYTRTLTSADVMRHRGWEWGAFVTWLRSRPIYTPLLAEMEDLACAS
ncbi:hypothetical protein ABIA39_004516 [Nocardia sp. GAS34]|uniref:hypothetical protein n=1 Tax=unclassified Nocardia TaxID=2637762 RepID=UPI003D19B1B3